MIHFICFDTEDNSPELLQNGKSGFNKRVTQICALSNRQESYYSKGDVLGFLKWLKNFPDARVYAHNLQYDLGNLFGRALDALDVTMVGSRIIKARWQNVTFLDSFNLWPMSLAKLGQAFGLKKGKLDVNSQEYVEGDVLITLTAIQFAVTIAERYGLRGLPSTLGGLSVKLWQAMSGENWFDDMAIAKEAYYGGRVELFSGTMSGRILYTDINSLYPHVMTKEFPDSMAVMKGIDHLGIAKVTLKVPKSFITPLPIRREDGSIWFPYGRLTGTWTTAEIQLAIDNGAKLEKVHQSFGSKIGKKYYQRFVRVFYKLRLEAKTDAEKLFFKLVLNNLYGQLAMSGTITRSLDSASRPYASGVHYGRKILTDSQIPLPAHVNYSHAAFITSYARIELFNFLKRIDEKSLCYCDTDSIFFACKDEPPFPISGNLGEMKLEAIASRVKTYGPKAYNFGEIWKAKGVRQKVAKEFLETGYCSFESPYRFREAVEFYDRDNKKQLSVWRQVDKHRQSDYDKKIFVDGFWFPRRFNGESVSYKK